jgi:hypothetical protein
LFVINTPKELIALVSALRDAKATKFQIEENKINISFVNDFVDEKENVIQQSSGLHPDFYGDLRQRIAEITKQEMINREALAEKELAKKSSEVSGHSLVADLDGLDPVQEEQYDPDYVLNNPPEVESY